MNVSGLGACAQRDLTIWAFILPGIGDFEALEMLGLRLRSDAVEGRGEERRGGKGKLTRIGQESDGLSWMANP